MMEKQEFEEFQKIPRLSRRCIITEKIDGTNAQIFVPEDGGPLWAGSKTRWIRPDDDNCGFARWVMEHSDELRAGLGFGRHYGEWWGSGIKRKYDMKEKRFSLFNTIRWTKPGVAPLNRVSLVPVLYDGTFSSERVDEAITRLRTYGSLASPGFMKPEGVVIYHVAGGYLFKKTLENDDVPKGKIDG